MVIAKSAGEDLERVGSSSETSSDAGQSSIGDPAELAELETFAGPWTLNTVSGCAHRASWSEERRCWTLARRPGASLSSS